MFNIGKILYTSKSKQNIMEIQWVFLSKKPKFLRIVGNRNVWNPKASSQRCYSKFNG